MGDRQDGSSGYPFLGDIDVSAVGLQQGGFDVLSDVEMRIESHVAAVPGCPSLSIPAWRTSSACRPPYGVRAISERAPGVQALLMICGWVAGTGSASQSEREVRPSSASQKPWRQVVPAAHAVFDVQATQDAGTVPTVLSK
jgi:hypothetical protein